MRAAPVPKGLLMSHTRVLLSMLCAVAAMACVLIKPVGARAAARTPQFHLPFGVRLVDYAKRFRGVRYVYGGSSPRSGFDCSGFVRYVYAHFGISLPHSSYAQFDRGRRIGRWALKPGDLVFFDGLGHVGMYIGNGRFIHAPHSGTRVRVERLAGWYSSRFVGARRLRSA